MRHALGVKLVALPGELTIAGDQHRGIKDGSQVYQRGGGVLP